MSGSRAKARAADEDVAALLARAQVAMIHIIRQLRQVSDKELPTGHYQALATIVKFGPISPSALADRESLHPAAASRVLNNLESRGLIVRSEDESDRRRTPVAATEEGVRWFLASRDVSTSFLLRSLSALKPGDVEAILTATPALEALAEAGWSALEVAPPQTEYLPPGQGDAAGRVATSHR